MPYDLDHGWPGGTSGRATLGGLGGGGRERSLTTDHRSLTTGVCEGIRADGRAFVLLDGASAVLTLQVAAELPAALLVGRRVVVLGDDPATWLVAGVFGSTMLNVASGLVQLDASSNLDVAGVYEVAGTQVVGARGAAVAAAVNAVAAPTKAEFDALVAVVNALRARLTAHGLTA